MMLPACLTLRLQVCSQNTFKYTPQYTFKYTPNCTRRHTPILHDYMLPSKLSRCAQVHYQAHSPLHSAEASHFQFHWTICSHVCPWVLDLLTGLVAGGRHQEGDGRWQEARGSRQGADYRGCNHNVSPHHRLNLTIRSGTTTRSHKASWS
jgi:hypothetical protein